MADPRNASDPSTPEAGPDGASRGLGGAGGPAPASALRSPSGAPVRLRVPMPPPDEAGRSYDGCNRECWKAGAHTLTWGGCEHAAKPEPTVDISRVYTDPEDGGRSIGFDVYTVAELAQLIEPALRDVGIRLGPNALAMLQRGEEVHLSAGEIWHLARAAADAIITHSNRDGS